MKPEREWIEAGGGSVVVKRSSMPAFDVPWHHHPEAELTRIDAGSGRCLVGRDVSGFGPGQLVLVGADLPHGWFSEGPPAAGSCRASVAQFDPKPVLAAAEAFPETRAVAPLLRQAAGGLLFPPGAADLEIDRLVDATDPARTPGLLLDALAVLAGCGRSALGPASAARAADPAVEAMVRLLQARSRGPVALAEVAAAAHLSESAAARRFSAAMGQGVTAYLHRLRVQAAESLLIDGDAGLAAVSAEAGFPNLAHFHRVFKRLRGETPAAWRRRVKAAAGPTGGSAAPRR